MPKPSIKLQSIQTRHSFSICSVLKIPILYAQFVVFVYRGRTYILAWVQFLIFVYRPRLKGGWTNPFCSG